jgi:hypothetical protein
MEIRISFSRQEGKLSPVIRGEGCRREHNLQMRQVKFVEDSIQDIKGDIAHSPPCVLRGRQ